MILIFVMFLYSLQSPVKVKTSRAAYPDLRHTARYRSHLSLWTVAHQQQVTGRRVTGANNVSKNAVQKVLILT